MDDSHEKDVSQVGTDSNSALSCCSGLLRSLTLAAGRCWPTLGWTAEKACQSSKSSRCARARAVQSVQAARV